MLITMWALCAQLELASAQDSAPAAPTVAQSAVDRVQTFEKLSAEFRAAQNEFYAKLRAAKDDQERGKLYRDGDPTAAFARRAWQLVDENARDATGLDALLWIFENVHEGDDRSRSLTLLREHHIASPKIAEVADRLSWEMDEKSRSFLDDVVARSPDRRARSLANLAIAQRELRAADLARRSKDMTAEEISGYESELGKDAFAKLRTSDPAQIEKSAETRLEAISKNDRDVKRWDSTAAAAADGILFELRNLAIGKVAPDIEGEDLFGKTFKLSEYRGKVVLVDFWGNW